jgi:phosphate transport system substrate-binding protein
MTILLLVGLTLTVAAVGEAALCAGEVDTLPVYQITSGVSGTLVAVGSDTMLDLMNNWTEGFRAQYPAVQVTLEEKGSNTAPPALIDGRSQLAPMSRPMKPDEISAFAARFGYPPTEMVVAIDGLAIFVHRDNPLTGLTLGQLATVFSGQAGPGATRTTLWKELGVADRMDAPITLYGRNPLSGTYTFFRQHVLGGGDFAPALHELPSSSALITSVAIDPSGIAYCGVGYATSGVRIVPVGVREGAYFPPSLAHCLDGSYPIARRLYIYINRPPSGVLAPVVREFLRFALSKAGQEVVEMGGFYSVPADLVATSLRLLSP